MCTITRNASDTIVAPIPERRTISNPTKNATAPVIAIAISAELIGSIENAFRPQGAFGSESALIFWGVTQIAAAYAPMPMKAEWLRFVIRALPIKTCKPKTTSKLT